MFLLPKFELLYKKNLHQSGINEISLFSNSSLLLTASDDGSLKLSLSSDLTQIFTLYGHFSYVTCCDFSPNITRIASGSVDESIKIWDTASSKCIKTISAHEHPICSVKFNSDERFLCSASVDETCRIWCVFSGMCLKTVNGLKAPVAFCLFSPNDLFLLIETLDSMIRLFEIQKDSVLAVYKGHQNNSRNVFGGFCKIEGQDEIFISSENGNLVMWILTSPNPVKVIPGGLEDRVAVDMYYDGKIAVTGGGEKEKRLRIWQKTN